MSLLALSTELICQIIRETTPRSFEALVLTCSRLHHVGQEFIPRHNALCRRYRRFKYDSKITCSRRLAYAIHNDPIIAEYLEAADFSGDHCVDINSNVDGRICNDIPTSILKALWEEVPVLKAAIELTFHGVDIERCCWDKGIIATIIILSLLRNVRQIVLPEYWYRLPVPTTSEIPDLCQPEWNILDAIDLDSSRHHAAGRILPNLQRIDLLHPPDFYDPVRLQKIAAFLANPTLIELCASHSCADHSRIDCKPFFWRYGSQVFNLRKITLHASGIGDRDLAHLLTNCPQLHTFHISYASARTGNGIDWDFDRFVKTVISSRADTLVDLSIAVHHLPGNIKGGLRSLQALSKLQRLELDVRFFFGPEVVLDTGDLSPSAYRDYAYASHWNGTLLPPLSSLLPSSIQSVRLLAGASREDILILKSLFKDFDHSLVPELTRMIVVRAKPADGMGGFPPQSDDAWRSVREIVWAAGAWFEESALVGPEWEQELWRES